PIQLALRAVHSGRVEEGDLAFFAGHHPENSTARRLRLRRDDRQLLAGEAVEQRALADVRPAQQRGKTDSCFRELLQRESAFEIVSLVIFTSVFGRSPESLATTLATRSMIS